MEMEKETKPTTKPKLRLPRTTSFDCEESDKIAKKYQLHQRILFDWLTETLPIDEQLAQELTAHIARTHVRTLATICDAITNEPKYLVKELKSFMEKQKSNNLSIKQPYEFLLLLIDPFIAKTLPKADDAIQYDTIKNYLNQCCNGEIVTTYPKSFDLTL